MREIHHCNIRNLKDSRMICVKTTFAAMFGERLEESFLDCQYVSRDVEGHQRSKWKLVKLSVGKTHNGRSKLFQPTISVRGWKVVCPGEYQTIITSPISGVGRTK
jgi:hypothetical protein